MIRKCYQPRLLFTRAFTHLKSHHDTCVDQKLDIYWYAGRFLFFCFVSSPCSISIQARKHKTIRKERRRRGRRWTRRWRVSCHPLSDGNAVLVAAAAVPCQQWHGCSCTEQRGESRDGEGAGGDDREAELRAAGGGARPLAPPLHLLLSLGLAKSPSLLHTVVLQVQRLALGTARLAGTGFRWPICKCTYMVVSYICKLYGVYIYATKLYGVCVINYV